MPKDPENFGPEGEKAAQEAIVELIREDNRFVGYLKAKNSDRLDSEGIDVMVFIHGGLVLPIQVRTTFRKINRFKAIHPLVRFVLIIKKRRHGRNALDPGSTLYRATIDYIKDRVLDFSRRAVRDACKDFGSVVNSK